MQEIIWASIECPLCLSEKSKRVIGRELYASNTFRRLSPSYFYLTFLDAFLFFFLSPLHQRLSASTLNGAF